MDVVHLILGFTVGASMGGIFCWLVFRDRTAHKITEAKSHLLTELTETRVRLEESLKRIEQMEHDLHNYKHALEQARLEATVLTKEQARVSAELESERKNTTDKLALLEKTDKKLREAFSALSAEALRNNNQSFLELAKTSLGDFQKHAVLDLEHRQKTIDSLVKPIHESLEKVDTKLHEVEKQRAGSQAILTTQMKSLFDTTSNLAKTLRTPNVRGGWGEFQLKRVVEMAGMIEHCHFTQKESTTTDTGRLVPDLVVKLPGGKNIIIDAKVPYIDYREAVEATDETVREAKLGEHAKHVREHMRQLSSKSYWSQFKHAPEFVFMFMPGEGYFSLALQHDPTLIEFGVEQKVIPASPLTLIALLWTVAYGWQQERITDNAQALSDLGRTLYDRVRIMAEHFDELEKGLRHSVDAYNKAVGTLETRILVTARRFKDLGVTVSDQIPELQPIDRAPRSLQAPELSDLASSDIIQGETLPDHSDE